VKARRRLICVLLAAATLAMPIAARQPDRVWRIGVLSGFSRPASLETHPSFGALLRGLKEHGYVEGVNLTMEWAFADDDDSRLPSLASKLVSQGVDAIVTNATPGIRAAQAATRTVPIVFIGGADPVGQGFVKSLAHPGGNTTGIYYLQTEIAAKQVEILRAFVPRLSRMGYLYNPDNSGSSLVERSSSEAAERLGIRVSPLEVRSLEAVEGKVTTAAQALDGLLCGSDLFLLDNYDFVARVCSKNRLPCVGFLPDFAERGGLAGYGPDRSESWYRLAEYLDRIFKGERPGDLPVQQPTKLILAINKATARALGLTIPPEILVQADKVIE
jgi:putative ABC transport system substrate-binding protein